MKRHHAEELPRVLKDLIREEIKSVPTASVGWIKTLDETRRRADIETAPDGAIIPDVPIASPFAFEETGDIIPMNPAEHDRRPKGIVLYTHHPIEKQLSSEKIIEDGDRSFSETNAVFLPAMLWFDHEHVPDHEPGERTIQHPDGAEIRMGEDSITVTGPHGTEVEMGGIDTLEIEEVDDIFGTELWEHRDPDEMETEVLSDIEEDPTAWPVGKHGESYVSLTHPSGGAVTLRDGFVSVEAPEHSFTVGRGTSPERDVLSGRYQHAHIIETADGPMLAGKQLEFREFIAWLTVDKDTLVNSGQPWVEEAAVYAEAYLEWLEDYLGRDVDPTSPFDWPRPEPMPPVDVHQSLPPVNVHGGIAGTEQTVTTPEPTVITGIDIELHPPATEQRMSTWTSAASGVQNPVAGAGSVGVDVTAPEPAISIGEANAVSATDAGLSVESPDPVVTARDTAAVGPATAGLSTTAPAPTVSATQTVTVAPGAASVDVGTDEPTASSSGEVSIAPAPASLEQSPPAPSVEPYGVMDTDSQTLDSDQTATGTLTWDTDGYPIDSYEATVASETDEDITTVNIVDTGDVTVSPGAATVEQTAQWPFVHGHLDVEIEAGPASLSATAVDPAVSQTGTVDSDEVTVDADSVATGTLTWEAGPEGVYEITVSSEDDADTDQIDVNE